MNQFVSGNNNNICSSAKVCISGNSRILELKRSFAFMFMFSQNGYYLTNSRDSMFFYAFNFHTINLGLKSGFFLCFFFI